MVMFYLIFRHCWLLCMLYCKKNRSGFGPKSNRKPSSEEIKTLLTRVGSDQLLCARQRLMTNPQCNEWECFMCTIITHVLLLLAQVSWATGSHDNCSQRHFLAGWWEVFRISHISLNSALSRGGAWTCTHMLRPPTCMHQR